MHLSVHLFILLSIRPFDHSSDQSVHPLICLTVHLFVRVFVHPFLCLSVGAFYPNKGSMALLAVSSGSLLFLMGPYALVLMVLCGLIGFIGVN